MQTTLERDAIEIEIDPDVRAVLAQAQIDGAKLILAETLDRRLYERTDRVLEGLGGRWDRSAKAHVFPAESDMAGRLAQALETGTFVPVPSDLADDADDEPAANVISLAQFVDDFGNDLMQAVSRQNPPVYDGQADPRREAVMAALKRQAFPAQRDVVQAVTRLLIDQGEPAAIINAEMGTGKSMMSICVAAVLQAEGYRRTLILSPPHLVYKWRREILETIPHAVVRVLNGPDTLRQLDKMREQCKDPGDGRPEFVVIGRVRIRMGFDWAPVALKRKFHRRIHMDSGDPSSPSRVVTELVAACPDCGRTLLDGEGNPLAYAHFLDEGAEERRSCRAVKPHPRPDGGRGQDDPAVCGARLWSLKRPGSQKQPVEILTDAMCQLPTIGPKTADRLIRHYGADTLTRMLAENPFDFLNLMDDEGELVFSDRQAQRMERSLANQEFAFGQSGYQASEYVKRYLPKGYFDLFIVDEGHEYKAVSSAQGQAMGVVASQCKKIVLLTGTLMGGYADDLFGLLWRTLTAKMREDGFQANRRGSLGPAAMAFMEQHGVLKHVFKVTEDGSHRTARGNKQNVSVKKAPGFGPKGIARFVLPFTAFLKLKDIGGDVLPPYTETLIEVAMAPDQAEHYEQLRFTLVSLLKESLRRHDKTLLGVVLAVLLAWPDCCFREETVLHPRSKLLLAFAPKVLDDAVPSPKEDKLIEICRTQKAQGRKVLVYTVYTGTRDTSTRTRNLLEAEGFKAAVLRASVEPGKREDWIADQVDRGVDVVICNPELVKTGLDLLDFPAIVYLNTGFNVYTVQQASRRSWRIGQKQPVEVFFLGYQDTAQIDCLTLMAKKIAVSQSTSGDMPDTGLDVLNQDGDSLEVALAKRLIAEAA